MSILGKPPTDAEWAKFQKTVDPKLVRARLREAAKAEKENLKAARAKARAQKKFHDLKFKELKALMKPYRDIIDNLNLDIDLKFFTFTVKYRAFNLIQLNEVSDLFGTKEIDLDAETDFDHYSCYCGYGDGPQPFVKIFVNNPIFP